jgi:hypothetical protein
MTRTIPRSTFLAAAVFAALSVVAATEQPELGWYTKVHQPEADITQRAASKGKQNFAYFTNW